MKNFLFLAGNVDVLPLLLTLKRNPQLWKEDTFLRDYPQGPFGEIESIMLRFPLKTVTQLENDARDQHECIDYPPYKFLTEARPLIMNLMTRVGGERLGRCMINKIAPGGKIFPHADTPAHADYYSRFHIVLESNEESTFRCGNEYINMQQGQVWWFNNKLEHEVHNEGETDRIHLIVDIRTSR